MDRIDRRILAELQADGRLTNAELASRVGLSTTPTLRRVRLLEERGVLRGYHADIDPEAVGLGFRVLVHVELEQSTLPVITAFEEAVVRIEEVVEAHRLFGEPDYLLQVAVRDAEAYERLYTTEISALPGVRRAVSQITMKTVKAGGGLPLPR